MQIRWGEKFRAFGIHFLLTALVASIAAYLVFGIWYPDPFDALAGGTRLFLLISGCDLALGPLLSLVVYNSRKSRGKLVFDYVVIAALQLSSVVYGVSIMAKARPVYVVFVGDRLEVVSKQDLLPEELAAAKDPRYATVPFMGIRFAATLVKTEDHNEALFTALEGRDVHVRPRFYVPYETRLDDLRKNGGMLDALVSTHPAHAELIARARAELDIPEERLRWLPVRYDFVFWAAIVDTQTGKPVRYLEFDPY
jgi:hypothetical protein